VGLLSGQTTPWSWGPFLARSKVRSRRVGNRRSSRNEAVATEYRVVRDGGTTVVRAESVGTASGIEHEIPVDLNTYPVLRWRWKIDRVVVSGDPHRKDKDDYAARVYVTFGFEPDKASFGERLRYRTTRALFSNVPFAAISYIWASRTRWAR
jgi:hypothetical protein